MAEKKRAKKKAEPKAKAKPNYETTEYNKLKGQVESDLKKEKGASPGRTQRLAKQVQKDISAENALTEAGMGHHDAKALKAAGIPADRIAQLTKQFAPSHPANAGSGFTANPTDPAQYAGNVLSLLGVPDTASNEKLLEDQMTVEGMPGSEDNPLATTLRMPGSSSVNSVGVQEYPSLAEGAQAEAQTLALNDPTIVAALKSGTATPEQYAKALAGSTYEGSDPSANAAYANSFLTDAGQPEQSFPGGGAGTAGSSDAAFGSQALTNAASSNPFANLMGNLFGGAQAAGTTQSLQSALAGLSASPEQQTLSANTTDAPGSPDQPTSSSQKTAVNPAALYQAQLAGLLPGITPGSAGKNG